MADLLLLFVPFFALVLLGWAAARRGTVPLEGIGALNSFVLYFGLTAMIFRLAASGALQQRGLMPLVLVYGLGGAGVLAAGLAWAGRAPVGRLTGGMAALVAVFPNTGFLGLPLLTGLLGPAAGGPVMATLLIDVLVFSSLCLAFAHSAGAPVAVSASAQSPEHGAMARGATGGAPARGEVRAALAQSLKGAGRNPLLWSMAAGMVFSTMGWRLTQPVDETLRLLSLAATPAALFTLGAILARAQRAAIRLDGSAGSGDESGKGEGHGAGTSPWVPVLLKLVLHPALVWLAGQALGRAGVAVHPQGLLTLTLAAALPSASNVLMLAEREGADTGVIARIILWTTALSLLTLTVLAHGLGVQGVAKG